MNISSVLLMIILLTLAIRRKNVDEKQTADESSFEEIIAESKKREGENLLKTRCFISHQLNSLNNKHNYKNRKSGLKLLPKLAKNGGPNLHSSISVNSEL